MANILTAQDFATLQGYLNAEDRYSYWSYLAAKGDTYAKLALGVITGDATEGYIAKESSQNRRQR